MIAGHSRLKVVYALLAHCCGESSGGGLVEEEGSVELGLLGCAESWSAGCENTASKSGCNGHVAGNVQSVLVMDETRSREMGGSSDEDRLTNDELVNGVCREDDQTANALRTL